MKIHSELGAILERYPILDFARAHSLAKSVEKIGADAEYRLTLDFLKVWIHERARSDSGNTNHWTNIWNQVSDLIGNALALNLNKRRTLMQIFNMLTEHCSASSN